MKYVLSIILILSSTGCSGDYWVIAEQIKRVADSQERSNEILAKRIKYRCGI